MKFIGWIFFILSWLTFFNFINFNNDPSNYGAGILALITALCFLKADINDLERKVDKLEDIR